MSNTCPYCNNCDTYVGKDVMIDSKYFNKCVECGEWSLHVPGLGQELLPVEIQKEELEIIFNQE